MKILESLRIYFLIVSASPYQYPDSNDHHRQSIDDPEREPRGPEEVPDMCIWESELFRDEACSRVTDEEYGTQGSSLKTQDSNSLKPPKRKKYHKQDDPLKAHLEKRIGKISDSVYHHRERAIIRTISWEFSVDIVADTTESECDRDTYCEDISDLEESVSVSLGKKKNSHENSEESAMKTHSSLPYGKYLDGIFYEK